MYSLFFFFNDTATTEIYTLSLHDALPIYECIASRASDPRRGHEPQGLRPVRATECGAGRARPRPRGGRRNGASRQDRKSTRLNSSHMSISYAVFCLKKKKKN